LVGWNHFLVGYKSHVGLLNFHLLNVFWNFYFIFVYFQLHSTRAYDYLKYHLKLLILGHFLKLMVPRYFQKVTRLNQNELIFKIIIWFNLGLIIISFIIILLTHVHHFSLRHPTSQIDLQFHFLSLSKRHLFIPRDINEPLLAIKSLILYIDNNFIDKSIKKQWYIKSYI